MTVWGVMGWVILWVVALVVIIAGALAQDALLARPAVREVVEAAARAGPVVVVVAVTVLVTSLAAMIVYTIRYGSSDDRKGKVITEPRVIGSIAPIAPGVSKLKMFGGKQEAISMESLIDGTATFGERMMVAGILTSMTAFFMIFVGFGLYAMHMLLILALAPVIPGIWFARILRDVWQDYWEAKKRVAAHRQGVL